MARERALALLAILLALISIVISFGRHSPEGGDLSLMCSGARAVTDGANPYDQAILERYMPGPTFPITYPPLAILAVTPACGAVSHAAIWTVLAAFTFLLLRGFLSVAALTLAAAVIAGFGGFGWTMTTGNPSIVELPIMATAVWALARSRAAVFGGAIGVLTFLKVAPVAYLASAVARFDFRRVVTVSGVALLVVAVLHGLSAWLVPNLVAPYWQAVESGFDGLITDEMLEGGHLHPALISLAYDLARALRGGLVLVAVFLGLAVLAAVWALVHLHRRRGSGDGMEMTAVILLLVAIATPRLKPYAFAGLVPALAVLLSRFNTRRRLIAIAATCVAPTLALGAIAYLTPAGEVQPAFAYKVTLGYMPLYAAMLLVMLAAMPERRDQES